MTSKELYDKAMTAQKEFESAFKAKENPAHLEILHAVATKLWHSFEDAVWAECKLPRRELLLKRANFG